ncbi:MAG: hypothetical protein H0W62_12460 [Chitinophagales bacterium]|nr:hypothetical protein [Chitinophagales bacterium]
MKKDIGVQLFFHSDYILVPIYFITILIAAFLIRNINLRDSPLKKFFIPGLLVKILGGIAMGLVYGFYYPGGDTIYYYSDAGIFNIALNNSVFTFFQFLFLPANATTFSLYNYTHAATFFRDPSGWMTDKVYGIISIFSFHSYPVMSMMIAVLSYTGVWALYLTFVNIYPKKYVAFAWAILFVPSVFFWGSGILKDSVTFGCLGWITRCSYQIFFRKKNLIINSFVLLVLAYISIIIKPYIIISFLPALLFWIFLTYRNIIKSSFLKIVSGPFVIAITLLSGYALIINLGNQFSKFSIENLMKTASDFQLWHGYLAQTQNESGYSLGTMTGTWTNVISKVPLAINVTLFRPYLWEAHSLVILAAALESAFILLFTVYVLSKSGIKNLVQFSLKNPTLFFCLFFSLCFAFAVGFTSYNFGALVRFKIPCIPFYLVGLIILNSLSKEAQLNNRIQKRKHRPFYESVHGATNEPEPVRLN